MIKPSKHKNKGFTLAELLLTLLILTIIATFTIPKIVTAQQSAKKTAVFKETVAAMSSALYNGYISGNMGLGQGGCTPSQYSKSYVMNQLNALKVCPNDSSVEGCWPMADLAAQASGSGVILASGAMIAGLRNCSGTPDEDFIMDWDGTNGSNVEGIDQIVLTFCIANGCSFSQRPGTVIAHPGRILSVTLFNEIFK